LPTGKQTGLGLSIPQKQAHVKKTDSEWNVYRTRFLIKAKKLSKPFKFVDALGRGHEGKKGDYLMEWCDGMRRIAPKKIFEDVYVSMDAVRPNDVVIASPLNTFPAISVRSTRNLRRQPSA
jgi:hypothetical protein